MDRTLFLGSRYRALRWLAQTFFFASHGPTRNLATKKDLRLQLTNNLSDLIDAWFPRTLDTEYGGFLADFDYQWQPNGPHQKRLEYQARQTRTAAQAAIFDQRYRSAFEAAEHGFRYLTDSMWDKKYGGWFYLLNQHGEPVHTEKHMHGVAYGIQACVEHHSLTGRIESLQFARQAFDWLDTHAHDSINGGYYSYLKQDGTPITTGSLDGTPPDPLETPFGLKDFNTTTDLLDALTDLYGATKDAHVGNRFNELRLIVQEASRSGIFYKSYTPDWKPADNLIEVGLLLQMSCTLIKASQLVTAESRNDSLNVACAMVDACLRDMWDRENGGFFYEASVSSGTIAIRDDRKMWWVQAEGLRALLNLALAANSGKAVDYYERWLDHWTYVDLNLVDRTYKGWSQLASAPQSPKAYGWKDASHEVRALIDCIRLLDEADPG